MSFTNFEWFTILMSFLFSSFLFVSNVCYAFFMKRNQLAIEEVSYLGSIGKSLLSVSRNGVVFKLGWIPFSSYVKPKGDEEENASLLNKVFLNTLGVLFCILLISVAYLSVHEVFSSLIVLYGKMYELLLGNLNPEGFRIYFSGEVIPESNYLAILFAFAASLVLAGNSAVFLQRINAALGIITGILVTGSYVLLFYRIKGMLSFRIILFFLLIHLLVSGVFYFISLLLIKNKPEKNLLS